MEMKIPKGHIHWESIYDENHELKQIVTSDEMRRKYYLYNVEGEKMVKVEVASSPVLKNKLL